MMGKYKMMRRDPTKQKEAKKLLEQIFELGKKGTVSKEAKIAAAYL